MGRGRVFVVLCVPLGVALLGSTALGDGGYWPEPAFPAMPTIPVQRAVVVHRDGVEALVVESAFESPSPNVGWILPLPAEPTELDVAGMAVVHSEIGARGSGGGEEAHDVSAKQSDDSPGRQCPLCDKRFGLLYLD